MKAIVCNILLLLALAAPAGAVDRIKVSKQFSGQLKLALPLFREEQAARPDLAAPLTNLLLDDLILSGYFVPVPNRAFVAQAEQMDLRSGKVNLAEWKATGAEILVKGSFRVRAPKIEVEVRVVDLRKARQVFGKKYSIGLENWRSVIHKAADEITLALTGERGLARTQIAFVSPDRGERKIYLMEGSGQNWREIDTGRGIAINPDWSPDGRTLVYTGYTASFPWIFQDNLETGKRRILSSFPGLNAFPAVSPDGQWLALTLSKDGNNEIYRMRLDNRSLQRLTWSRGNDCSPTWSSDGSRIAFTSDRGGSPQIYLMNADGSNVRRLRLPGSYNTCPAWSPRGDLIAYSSRSGGSFDIYLVDLGAGQASRVTRDGADDEDPSWAPDGRHIVYSSRRGKSTNLFVVDILNPAPIQLTRGRECTSPAWGPYVY